MDPGDTDGVISVPGEDLASALSRILSKLRHLDLTGHIKESTPAKQALGGYSDVYIGHVSSTDLHYDRRVTCTREGLVKVAIKTIRVILKYDVKFAKSLAREMAVWSKLNHPNILPLLGYSYEDDCPSLISEWIVNGTVRDFLKENPSCNVVRLALGVANGLEYMHERDIVHSDMKADNILIGQDGEPLICDFGISRMLDSSQSYFVSTTHDHSVKGSTRWMAIEFFGPGEAKHSKETDVWAYGMTLYEIITKELPFPKLKQDVFVITALMRGQLPSLPSHPIGESLSIDSYREMSSLCVDCWAGDPSQRPTMAQITLRLLPLSKPSYKQWVAQMNNALSRQNPLIAMQRQQGMQSGGAGGLPNMTPQIAQPFAQQRQTVTDPAMIQINRQLGLLNRTQKQQPQNGPTNFSVPGSSFAGQQNVGLLPFQTTIFPPKPDDGRMPIPQGQQQFQFHAGTPNTSVQAHASTNENVQQTGSAGDGSRPLSIDEAKLKATRLRATIAVEKQYLEQASKNAAPEMMVHIKRKEVEIQQKEVIFHKVVDYIRMTESQQSVPQLQQPAPPNSGDGQGGGGLNSMGFPNTIQQLTGQHHIQPNQNWSSQMDSVSRPSQFAGNGLSGNQALLNSVSQNGTAWAPQQQLNSSFHPNFVQPQQRQLSVPRTNPTPQQQQKDMFQAFLQQNNTHSSPPSSGSAPLVGQGSLGHQSPMPEGQENQHRLNGLSFPSLAREKFQQQLQEWWKRNGISLNPQMLTIGNREIDLHQLHTEVLQYGGAGNVRHHDLWNVIAAKMGWTPATISEAGRTQDQIAEQLKAVYAQLESFEHTYMATAVEQSLTAPQQQTTDHQGASGQRRTTPNQASRQPLNSQQMLQMMRLAGIPSDQMRASGYPENLIENIEQNRAGLQAALHRMTMQRLQRNQHQQQQQLQAPGIVLNGSLPFQDVTVHNSSSLPSQAVTNTMGHPGALVGSNQANELSAQQRPQPTAQQLPPQDMQMLEMLSNLRRPTNEMTKRALEVVEQMKQNIVRDRPFRPRHAKQLSEADKAAFPDLFEIVCNLINQIFMFLHEYLAATNDVGTVKGALRILDMCDKQQQLVQSANPVYVLDIPALHGLLKTCTGLKSRVGLIVQRVRASAAQAEENQAPTPIPQQSDPSLSRLAAIHQGPSPQNIAPSPAFVPPRPSTAQSQPPHRVQQNLRHPPSRTQSSPACSSFITQSDAHAATPLNMLGSYSSVSGLTHNDDIDEAGYLGDTSLPSSSNASPAYSQSSVAMQRGQSIASFKTRTPSTPLTGAVEHAASMSSSMIVPVANLAQFGPSSKGTSLKRLREDPSEQAGSSVLSNHMGEETTSKRIKNNLRSVSYAEPLNKQAEVENIKTTDDAANFYDDITSFSPMSNNAKLPPKVQDTLGQSVKTVGNGLGIPDAWRNSSVSGLANADNSSPTATDGDDFLRVFDFTAFQQDDDKANTPNLVPASPTNPSFDSGAGPEVDHPPVSSSSDTAGDRTKFVDTSESEPKVDFFDTGSDSLRLGIWGEIDGGESGSFTSSDMWKWDAVPSSSGDNPWAISN